MLRPRVGNRENYDVAGLLTTFQNNTAIRAGTTPVDKDGAAGINCCFVNFGGRLSSFIGNRGEGCGSDLDAALRSGEIGGAQSL